MTYKIKLRTDKINKKSECPLVVELSHIKNVTRIPIGISLKVKDFDVSKVEVNKSCAYADEYNHLISIVKKNLANTEFHFNEIMRLRHVKYNPNDYNNIFKEFYCGLKVGKNAELLKEVLVYKYNTNKTKSPQIRIKGGIDPNKLMAMKELVDKISNEENDHRLIQILDLPLVEESKISKHDRDQAVVKEQKQHFITTWEKYLAHSKKNKSENTAERIPDLLIKLQAFSKLKKIDLTFENLDEQFGQEFIDYLYDDHYNYQSKSYGLSDGTVDNNIKGISAFLNWAHNNGHQPYNYYKKWKTFCPETDRKYLTEENLVKLLNYKFEPGSKDEKIADIFLFSCYTGMRISDIEKWIKSLVNDGCIKYTAYKTKKKCIVGINPVSLSILEKYDYKLPKIHRDDINKEIKNILGTAGITEITTKEMSYRNVKKITEHPLNELISMHSGRRTFINLMISKSVQIAHLSTMVGNSIKTLMIYYKNDPNMIKKIMNDIDFETQEVAAVENKILMENLDFKVAMAD